MRHSSIAAAWSPVAAPASWELTAAQFRALRDDDELLAIAATIPPEKLPPLLFAAAATFLVLEIAPRPLRAAASEAAARPVVCVVVLAIPHTIGSWAAMV